MNGKSYHSSAGGRTVVFVTILLGTAYVHYPDTDRRYGASTGTFQVGVWKNHIILRDAGILKT